MASMQCFKKADQTYHSNQGQYHSSHSSHQVSTQTQWTSKTNAYYPDTRLAKSQTAQFYSQTQTTNPSHYAHSHSHSHSQTTGYGYATGSTTHTGGHGLGLTQNHHGSTHGHHELTHNHGLGLGHTNSCNGMATASRRHCGRRGEHKMRGLFQRMKDRLSGDTSCSSSDSESDDEHCETRGFRRQNC